MESVGEEARSHCRLFRVTIGWILASVPIGKAPGHLRGQPGGGRGALLSAACASCPSIGSQSVSPPAPDASPEVPRHQAQQSQLVVYRRASGPTGRPVCFSLPAACPCEGGRQPIQVAEVPATGCLGPAGKLAGLASVPICQPVPDERAGELGPGTLGCPPTWSSKATEALALLFPLSHTAS